jgi:hypothetical protein
LNKHSVAIGYLVVMFFVFLCPWVELENRGVWADALRSVIQDLLPKANAVPFPFFLCDFEGGDTLLIPQTLLGAGSLLTLWTIVVLFKTRQKEMARS